MEPLGIGGGRDECITGVWMVEGEGIMCMNDDIMRMRYDVRFHPLGLVQCL